jgi:hypothetical protein
MSPRRRSRARTTQPAPGAPTHSGSSSSVSSGRTERATRSAQKQSSPQKSSTPHSLLSDEGDEPAHNPQIEPPQTRRRARGHDNDEDESTKLEDDVDEEMAEEEEITRCICGQDEYPGPPSDTGKSRDAQLSSLADSDLLNDEAGGLYIQCDICKVWQHGGCVGIMEEAATPDEYFCEECRKDLHKVMTSPKGYVLVLIFWRSSIARWVEVNGPHLMRGQRLLFQQLRFCAICNLSQLMERGKLTNVEFQSEILSLPPCVRPAACEEGPKRFSIERRRCEIQGQGSEC